MGVLQGYAGICWSIKGYRGIRRDICGYLGARTDEQVSETKTKWKIKRNVNECDIENGRWHDLIQHRNPKT